ncbi:hypothetical protein, no similarity [Maudiozyma saulgeensis]|uniref:Zinc finger C3HC4 RING-type domain-containing protein n=1 Tax=Maudiozyma saulgeensis TaxID=1789683 RepID=A0A1X7QZ05_9SACH|nr:hypothetical protein, no similarity [Kazachstania saulgeensis]
MIPNIVRDYQSRIKKHLKNLQKIRSKRKITTGNVAEGCTIISRSTLFKKRVYLGIKDDGISRIILSTKKIHQYRLPLWGTTAAVVTINDIKVLTDTECASLNEDKCIFCFECINGNESEADIVEPNQVISTAITEIDLKSQTDDLGSERLESPPIIVETPCEHRFHKKCLSSWIEYNIRRDSSSLDLQEPMIGITDSGCCSCDRTHLLCPICRFDISIFKLVCTNLDIPICRCTIKRE